MKKKLTTNVQNVAGVLTPLMFFDCLFDLDFGLICTVAKNYLDPEVFDPKLSTTPIREIIKTLYNRKVRNPLIPFTQSAKLSEVDSLLDEFLSDEETYKEIVQYSSRTGLYNLLQTFLIHAEIKPTVIVPDEICMEKWNSAWHNPRNVDIVMLDELTQNSIKDYQQIYCKDPETILEFEKRGIAINDKTIYVAAYHFNLYAETDEISNAAMRMIAEGNRIDIIDLYNRELLEGKKNDDQFQ